MGWVHVVSVLLILSLASCMGLQLTTGPNILINSSRNSEAFQLVLQTNAQPSSTFQLYSQLLSPHFGTHTLTCRGESLEIVPSMAEETVIFNDYHDGQYWLALNHFLPDTGEAQHFVPVEVMDGSTPHELLLPGLSIPMPFLPEQSFFHCEGVLLSVQSKDSRTEIALFSPIKQKRMWSLRDEWSRTWRHQDHGLHYGWAEREAPFYPIKLIINNGKQCVIEQQHLQQNKNENLDANKYYSFHDLLQWAEPLKAESREKLEDL